MIKQFKCKIYWVEIVVRIRTDSTEWDTCLWSSSDHFGTFTDRSAAIEYAAGNLEHIQTIAGKLARNNLLWDEYSKENNKYRDDLIGSSLPNMEPDAVSYHMPLFEDIQKYIRSGGREGDVFLDNSVDVYICNADVFDRVEP